MFAVSQVSAQGYACGYLPRGHPLPPGFSFSNQGAYSRSVYSNMAVPAYGAYTFYAPSYDYAAYPYAYAGAAAASGAAAAGAAGKKS